MAILVIPSLLCGALVWYLFILAVSGGFGAFGPPNFFDWLVMLSPIAFMLPLALRFLDGGALLTAIWTATFTPVLCVAQAALVVLMLGNAGVTGATSAHWYRYGAFALAGALWLFLGYLVSVSPAEAQNIENMDRRD